ncbi:MBL fold metallo-hydrolase [Paenibacillus flagellatus]|uniref:Metallo-beta-lactamase domain-containing protein n=1 Tax=Paenibacillus flagellatus TaxID=2211139 RepID=A0A2V5KQD9_9BACL|nr:MBL fold metallo-hydrolase [Paenibacillus flagellatus]PYI53527.1 hypothetical protein DLM86_17340 [Paenibacillus flagellatus]
MLKPLSDNLFLYEDSCSVYVVRSGSEALLIDFGGGGVLDALGAIGVERVAGVWMTHHHRDQGQGLGRAAEAGIPILVPHAERELFDEADLHWQRKQLSNEYSGRQDRFSLLRSVPVADTLRDYSEHVFGGWTLTVLPTPGHTVGSISVLARRDGRTYAFTGDLIAAPGKIWSLAATQWSYNGGEGLPATAASLLDLKDREPDVLLPSHGAPIANPGEAIDLTVSRLRELMAYRGHNPRLLLLRDKPYENVTPHLLASRASFANYYVLLSDSGKALLFDFGYDFMTGMAVETARPARRPWLYSLPALKRNYGVARIDVVVPTHYHDDHVAGINLLRDVEGTRVWAPDNFADVLERPERFDVQCLWFEPIPVDRRLPLGTPIRWEEYELTLYEQGGHTLYAAAIFLEVDGKKVLVGGDQYQGEMWNYVYRNRFRIPDYAASAALYRRLAPDVVVTGHAEPLWTTPAYFDALDERGEALERLHRELLPLGEADFGAEGFAARLEPYQAIASPGETIEYEAETVNPFGRPAELVLEPVLPTGWTAEPAVARERFAANETRRIRFAATVPPGAEPVRRERIAVDVTADGRRFGQQAEALVTVVRP